ncbi:MAG: OmpA family protein [Sphingomonas sp.]|uniref:OmpA family protein n=1 Tax=Sphingomonas sp. TaxID=28214 RepID=UPI0025D9B9D3|nr:OmpA family protein [Sphingomonas sp.]MBX3563788.1 OmpA family protein [Sphingomonas sp.]
MRRASGIAAALALAACNAAPSQDPVSAPAVNQAEPRPAPAAPQGTTGNAIGQTSALTGATSPLTGAVTDFRVTVTDTATVVELATDTLFDFDKADLTPAAEPNLARTAELIRKGKQGTIAITGHTDAKGDDSYNQKLSERRAEAVAAWLRKQDSLKGWTFTTTGKGETAPIAPNTQSDGSDDPQGRAKNRRVEVTIPKG